MSLAEENKPIYDDRVEEILKGMATGKTRDELANSFGHKSTHAIDKYMKTRNFVWNRTKQAYIPAHTRLEGQEFGEMLDSSKASQVISLFNKEGTNSKIVAKRLGFQDHREMASYMKGKGYVWSMDQRNYVKEVGEVTVEDGLVLHNSEDHLAHEKVFSADIPKELSRFLPMLELLERNKDRLLDVLIPASEAGEIPRYVVPGVFITKSVHMASPLDQLIREFSREKNVSQRDIFEVALIQFFRRYGFEREVESLLGKR